MALGPQNSHTAESSRRGSLDDPHDAKITEVIEDLKRELAAIEATTTTAYKFYAISSRRNLGELNTSGDQKSLTAQAVAEKVLALVGNVKIAMSDTHRHVDGKRLTESADTTPGRRNSL